MNTMIQAQAFIQFPAIISFTKAVDMYYKSTKTDLQICTVKILAIKRNSCTTKVWHTESVKVPCGLLTEFDAEMATLKPNPYSVWPIWLLLAIFCVNISFIQWRSRTAIFHILQRVNANKCNIILIRNMSYGMCFTEKANRHLWSFALHS